MDWDFEELKQQAARDIGSADDLDGLEQWRIHYLGRKGLMPQIYASLGSADPEQKRLIGQGANTLRAHVEALLSARKDSLSQQGREHREIDVTLPGVSHSMGHKHILTQTMEEICAIFENLGFKIQDGPEVETEFNNFTALNIPVDHPSRDAFDTFYLDAHDPTNKKRHLLLRSHTSPGQMRIMQAHKPPLAVIIPGKVYRPDAVDASHSFMFHQLEGLLVDKEVTFSDLKGLLTAFCKRFFGPNVKMRFRPHFFPFTEPSAEVDISANIFKGKGDRWLEILGCGMVHPKVFEAAGYPSNTYKGLAFGLGIDRIAMLKYGIHDIRLLYENDQRFLKQF